MGLPHSVNKAFYFNEDVGLTVKDGTGVEVVHAEILLLWQNAITRRSSVKNYCRGYARRLQPVSRLLRIN